MSTVDTLFTEQELSWDKGLSTKVLYAKLEDHARKLERQRDELAEALRGLFDARGCEHGNDDGSVVISSEWIDHCRAALAKLS